MRGSLFTFHYCTSVTPKSLSPETQTDLWLLINISTQCQSMRTNVVGASCWARGWRGGKCVGEHGWYQDQAEKKRSIEPFPLFLQRIFFLPWKFFCVLFYPGNLETDLMLLPSFLSCVPICSCELWIKLKSACALYSLLKPKYLQRWGARKARKDLWDIEEAGKGTAERSLLLDTSVSPLPVPGSDLISSSSPFREVSGLLWAGQRGMQRAEESSFVHSWEAAASSWICDS